MYATDFDSFNAILGKLGAAFGKELTNEARAAYWEALKDQPLALVQERATAHARHGKFFPKPFELRPKDDKARTPPHDSEAFREGEKRAHDRLEALCRDEPLEWLRQVSPKVYELGRAKGMPDGLIESRLNAYAAARAAK